MIEMSLTVLSGGVANSPSSIGISLIGMAGTLRVIFLQINTSSTQILILTEQQKKKCSKKKANLTTGQKKGLWENALSCTNILRQGEDALENV